MSKNPINKKKLKLESLQAELEANGLGFLKKEIEAIKSYDFSVFQPTSKDLDLDLFKLDLHFVDISKDTLTKKVEKLIEETELEDLVKNVLKNQDKLKSISNREIESSKDTIPFAVKISRSFDNNPNSKNCINEIAFSAYKIALPKKEAELHQNNGLNLFKSKHENEWNGILNKNGINSIEFEKVLFPSFITLFLESHVLEEIASNVAVESLDFLRNNYSNITSNDKIETDKVNPNVKKNTKSKNSKNKNPFLNAYVFSCGLNGKFIGVDFEVAGKLENEKISFAAEFIFNGEDKKALSIAKLKENFSYDLEIIPAVEPEFINEQITVKVFYENQSFYAIAEISETFQIQIGFGKKKFIITQLTIDDENKEGKEDSNILKDIFGLKNIFLLIQEPGALSEDNKLLIDFKNNFNITDKDQEENEDEENENVENSDKTENVEIENGPFEKNSLKELNEAQFALGAQLRADSFDELKDPTDDNGIVPAIMDFIGAKQIDFYGVYKPKTETNVSEKEFFLYIDNLGNPERFFSVSDLKISWFSNPYNTGFEGSANLNFKLENESEKFSIEAKAGFSRKSMYFGGEINKSIKLNDYLTIKKAAGTVGYSRLTRSATFGIGGMIEGLCTDKTSIFNLQGAVSLSVLGSTVRPTLVAAAATSSGDEVTLADFIHGATTLDLSFVPSLGLLKIQDIEMTQQGVVTVDQELSNDSRTSLSTIEEENKLASTMESFTKALDNFKGFNEINEYSVTEIGNSQNYLVTDKTRMIHYKITNTGGINLVSQFYACLEETTIGATTYSPGFFVAGQLDFLGFKTKFLFDINKASKTFTAALSISPINILGGLIEFKYFDRNKEYQNTNQIENRESEKVEYPGALKLFSDDDKKSEDRGPIMYCSYGGSIDTLNMYMNAELSLFWGFSKIQADVRVKDNKIEAYANYNFAIFKTSLVYNADIQSFGGGNFYLKLDLEVESLNQKLKDLANSTRKAADDANAKLDSSLKDLVSKENERKRIYGQIDNINREIDRLSGWRNILKRAGLRIEKSVKYVEYGVISLAITVLEGAIAVLKAAITAGAAVVGGVLDAAAWVVQKIGQIFSIDSLLLEIDYQSKSESAIGKKVKFNAEADFTILGQKANPKLDLEIDFSKDLFDQILDQLSAKAKTIKDAIDKNGGTLPDEFRREEIKIVTITPDKVIVPEFEPIHIHIESTTVNVQKHNNAIDNLYSLLVENDFAKEYIDKGPEDSDDVVYWEMAAMREKIESLPKDNFIKQLDVVFSGNEFNERRDNLSQHNGDDQLSKEINTMFTRIDQLSTGLKVANATNTVDLSKISSEKVLRREFIKYFNDFMNDSE